MALLKKTGIIMTTLLTSIGIQAEEEPRCLVEAARQGYSDAYRQINVNVGREVDDRNPVRDISLEQRGCIVEYGLDVGFSLGDLGLPSINQVCGAVNDFVDERMRNLERTANVPVINEELRVGTGVNTRQGGQLEGIAGTLDDYIEEVNRRSREIQSGPVFEDSRGGQIGIPGTRR